MIPTESPHTVKAGGFTDMLPSPPSFAAQRKMFIVKRQRDSPVTESFRFNAESKATDNFIRNKSGTVG
ncbi:MAG: hypothetical protein NC078_11165 [Ruminococcus sp.]|nr:hypothetical protein [Ruminococcus sp.]